MGTAIWVIITAIGSFFAALAVAVIAPMVSHAVKLAEFRQAWINDQRKDVADYIGLSRRWIELYEKHNDALKDGKSDLAGTLFNEHFDLTSEALVVLWRIKMRMNPLDNPYKHQDDSFIQALDDLIDPAKPIPHSINPLETQWRPLANRAVEQARIVFKTEWERTKQAPPHWLWDLPPLKKLLKRQ